MIWIALLVLALHAPSAEIRIWQTPIETGNRNSGEKILHTAFRYLDRSIALIVFNQDSGDRSVRILCGNDAFILTTPSRSITTATWTGEPSLPQSTRDLKGTGKNGIH